MYDLICNNSYIFKSTYEEKIEKNVIAVCTYYNLNGKLYITIVFSFYNNTIDIYVYLIDNLFINTIIYLYYML